MPTLGSVLDEGDDAGLSVVVTDLVGEVTVDLGNETAAAPAGDAKPAASTTPTPTPKPATTAAKTPAAAPAGASNAVFPSAVDAKYSKESEGKARMHTCLDQYNANKTSNGNGDLKWIQKGGGYYSECNKKLKGA